jgi:hypothetical protein
MIRFEVSLIANYKDKWAWPISSCLITRLTSTIRIV